jgi:hypothetical protein
VRNAHKYARPRRNIWARSAREAPSAANMVAVQRPSGPSCGLAIDVYDGDASLALPEWVG